MPDKPIPRDLAFFLEKRVFPHLPPSVVEDALGCAEVLYLAEGEEKTLRGLLVVYSGSIAVDGASYGRGDYVVASGRVVAQRDSVVIYFPGECGRLIEAGMQESEGCVVGDLVRRAPICVEPGTGCRRAVEIMAREGISSVLVCEGERAIAIFTDTDLRRVVAREGCVPAGVAVEDCGTRDPMGVPEDAPCSEAVRLMMERYVKHIVVYSADGAGVRGVVSVRDVAYLEALGPLYARQLVAASSSVDELVDAYGRVREVLRRFFSRLSPAASQARLEHYSRMASLALRSVVEKAASLAASRLGVTDGVYYMVSGSLARQEQPLPTDRDTLLVYNEDKVGGETARRFAEEVENILDRVGFPGCEHGYTARRMLYSSGEINELLTRAAEDPAGNIVVVGFLQDADVVWPPGGDGWLRRGLVEAVASAGSAPAARAAMAAYRPRLGLLGRLPRRVDLKRDLVAPLVYSAKALALEGGVWRELNTRDRLLAVASENLLPADLLEEALHAYRVGVGYAAWLLAVRGVRVVETSELSGYERHVLRASIEAAARLVDRVRSLVP